MSWPRNWNRSRTLALLLFASLAFNVLLGGMMIGRWGWHGDHHQWGEGRQKVAKYWLRWTLGDDAAPKIEAMWDAHREAMQPLREGSREARRAIKAALAAESFNAEDYAAALKESRIRSMAVRASHHAFMVRLARTLTPDQRQKMAEFAGRRKWRHHRE